VTERDQLECRVHRLGSGIALGAGPCARLLDAVACEHTERDRDWQRRREVRERARDRVREHIEMRRLAAYEAAERHHRFVPACPRQGGDGWRELEGASYLELVDDGAGRQGALQSPLGKRPGDLFVPSGPYECHTRFDKPVSQSRGRLPTHGHLAQSSPRMRSPRVAR
jgi:hypothetical protein